MTYVTEKESEERLNSPLNAVVTLNLSKRGRPPGVTNTPQKLRELAGTLAHFRTAKDVAQELNLTPQQVHHYKHGRTTFGKEDPELKNAVERNLDDYESATLEVRRDAMTKLKLAMGLITEKKLDDLKAPGLASVAKDMAIITEKLTPKRDIKEGSKVSIAFYSPEAKRVEDYQVITVEAKEQIE